MEPIVNGLENEYTGRIEFRSIDAYSTEGEQAFKAYQLLGHPGYVLLNESGDVIWIGVGEQPGDQIKIQLDAALEN